MSTDSSCLSASPPSGGAVKYLPSILPPGQEAIQVIPFPNRIFVGGINTNETSESNLRDYFVQFGTVKEVKLIPDKTGNNKGYGFVTFESVEDAKKIIDQAKSGETFAVCGKKVNIDQAYRKVGSRTDQVAAPMWVLMNPNPYQAAAAAAATTPCFLPAAAATAAPLRDTAAATAAPALFPMQYQQPFFVPQPVQYSPNQLGVPTAVSTAAAAAAAGAPAGQALTPIVMDGGQIMYMQAPFAYQVQEIPDSAAAPTAAIDIPNDQARRALTF